MSGESRSLLGAFREETDGIVFGIGVLLTILAIGALALWPDTAAKTLTAVNTFLWKYLGWLYLWAMFLAVVFCLWLLVGPWGNIKFGGPDVNPEFSFFQFFAMLFSAGLATGLVFYGPVEGLLHYSSGPPFLGAKAGTAQIIPGAVQYTMLHWGISPWAAYLVFGITVAYYVYQRDAPVKPSTIFAPFVGVEKLDENWTRVFDAGMVVVCVGGMAVSLGFVVTQFMTGISYNWGIEFGDIGIILLTVILTVGFTASAAVGVKRGIRRVSMFNMYLFFTLLVVAFLFGPTSYLLNLGSEAFGGYVSEFIEMSLYANVTGGAEWVGAWTVFYWAWWFSFAPMIGIFIARICRGRTIRQVIFAGLIGTSAASFPWFIVMGGSSLWAQNTGRVDILGAVNEYGIEVAGFPLFEYLMPFGQVFSVLYLLLVLTFLITTVDSTTLSIAMFTTSGDTHPPVANRIAWGVLVGVLTSLLLIMGGISALQDLVVLVGLPIAFVIGLCIIGLTMEFEQRSPVILTERYERTDGDEKRESTSLVGYLTKRRTEGSSD